MIIIWQAGGSTHACSLTSAGVDPIVFRRPLVRRAIYKECENAKVKSSAGFGS